MNDDQIRAQHLDDLAVMTRRGPNPPMLVIGNPGKKKPASEYMVWDSYRFDPRLFLSG